MTKSSNYIFVCGGNGFIGSHLVKHLTRRGSPWSAVKALVRGEEGAVKVRAQGGEPVLGDLLEPSGPWQKVAAGAAYVINCAQPAMTGDQSTRPAMDQNLLRALDPERLRRIVMVFGSSYYGRTEEGHAVDETMSPRRPVGFGPLYAPGIEALKTFGRGLDWVAACPGGVYGRGTWFLELYLSSIQKGEPIIMRDPPPVWPYIQIEDCVRAIEFLLTVDGARLDEVGREVIIVDDEPVAMSRFAECVSEIVGKPPTMNLLSENALRAALPPFFFEYLTANMVHKNGRLKRLGFELKYPGIREGIRALDLPRL